MGVLGRVAATGVGEGGAETRAALVGAATVGIGESGAERGTALACTAGLDARTGRPAPDRDRAASLAKRGGCYSSQV
jgi:hypothetical protein